MKPGDTVPFYAVPSAGAARLVPHVNSDIRERLPFGKDLIVKQLDVIAPCDRDSILTWIMQSIAAHDEVPSAIVTSHNAAAGWTRATTTENIPLDENR